MYPFYAFHLRGKKGASLGPSLPGHRINDGQFRRSWNARSTLSSENSFLNCHSEERSDEESALFSQSTEISRFTLDDNREDVLGAGK
jgi:hypothetical protein